MISGVAEGGGVVNGDGGGGGIVVGLGIVRAGGRSGDGVGVILGG